MAFKFMLRNDPEIATFHEWSNVMYEDGWRLQHPDPKFKSLPTHGARGQPVNYEHMIHNSYRWTSKDPRSPRTDPIFISCVWVFSDILQARVEFDPTSINLESDVPQRAPDPLEKAWWTTAEPANRVRALDLACLYENYDCTKILLEAGAKATSHLALSFGIRAQRADIVQLLLEHGAPSDKQTDIEMWKQEMEWPTGFGSNPLHQAVIVGSPTILDMLLRHGADANIRIEGVSAFDLAKGKGMLELMRRLTDNNADSENGSTLPLDEHSVQIYNHILFSNFLQHLTRQERLCLYFGLQRSEIPKSEHSEWDVKALLTGGAEGPLFTYSKNHELLVLVTQNN